MRRHLELVAPAERAAIEARFRALATNADAHAYAKEVAARASAATQKGRVA
jgi:hypothetical protein